MLTVAFGTRTDTIDHPLVAKALALSREFMLVLKLWISSTLISIDIFSFRNCTGPVSNMTDFVPILQHLPANFMIKRAKALHQGLVETYGGMVNDIEDRMKREEKVPDCLVKTLVELKCKEELDHLDMAILCSAFMIGGVETVRVVSNMLKSSTDTTILDGVHYAMVFSINSCLPRGSAKSPR